jgi:hypothetical protein
MAGRAFVTALLALGAVAATANDSVPRCAAASSGHPIGRPAAMPTLASSEGLRLGRDRQGALQLWAEAPGAYLSPELGVVLIAPDGAECSLPLPATNVRGAVIRPGAASVAALEVGLCSADGCLPVRLEIPPAR